MFRDAFAIAREFTLPVIITKRLVNGRCVASIATFVVINEDGWIATAGHVLEELKAAMESSDAIKARQAAEAGIRADTTIDEKTRRDRLKALGKPKPDDVDRCAALWAVFPAFAKATQFHILKAADFGIARLQPFDKSWIKGYPTFKDPNRNFEPGVSLCKLGFPFHSFLEPTYVEEKDTFQLPDGALPVPLFPLEGIFTRVAQIALIAREKSEPIPTPEMPLLCVETSSPGLRGQSGGPTFDTKGVVWAIQSRTSHWPLDFSNSIPPQYLHVGLGVHPATMFHVFDTAGVKYSVSDY